MEGHLQNTPKLVYQVDNDDIRYVSKLSTLLVATIQEAKDRISQIEYIFCSQLYPDFQSKSKIVQKIYSEAQKAAEDVWIEKENDLLLQLEKHKVEKQESLEEIKLLKLEKETISKELEEKVNILNAKLKSQQIKFDELESEFLRKSKEVDTGMEMQDKLIHVIENKNKQLKEHEEKTNEVVEKLDDIEKKVNELQEKLAEKTEELAKVKEQNKNLQKKTVLQALAIMNFEQQPIDYEKEKRIIMAKLENAEDNVCKLEAELRKKTEDAEKGRKLREQLLHKIDLSGSEMKSKKLLEEHEKEEQLLLAKVKSLEKKVDELQVSLTERKSEVAEGRDLCKNLLQQIDLKTSEVVSEKKKTSDIVDAYKRLKSQYNFLVTRCGLTTENMLPQYKLEKGIDSLRNHQNPKTSPDLESKNFDMSVVAHDTYKVKTEIGDENLEDEKGVKSVQTSRLHSPSSTSNPAIPKCPNSTKSAPVAGTKRPASYWRDTRSRKCQGGPDPHDDFLDTPLENIRENLNKVMKDEARDFSAPVLTDMNLDRSDDETQDMNVNRSPQMQQKQVPVAGNGKKGFFKYVESVRKKAERENLKGIECKQCKKFYDAVLPNDGDKDTDGNKQNLRCEHHDGVSRHRYRYAPPLTPEGFWNIGFESEM